MIRRNRSMLPRYHDMIGSRRNRSWIGQRHARHACRQRCIFYRHRMMCIHHVQTQANNCWDPKHPKASFRITVRCSLVDVLKSAVLIMAYETCWTKKCAEQLFQISVCSFQKLQPATLMPGDLQPRGNATLARTQCFMHAGFGGAGETGEIPLCPTLATPATPAQAKELNGSRSTSLDRSMEPLQY